MRYLRAILLPLVTLALCSCATLPPGQNCPPGTQKLAGCPPESAVADPAIDKLYEGRTWKPAKELGLDPVTFADTVRVPVNDALVKLIGPDHSSSLDSLATKIWLIEHAEHTVDVMYYIFKRDLVGYSMLGALCDAVGRGVDVRIMVDSMGSFSFTHSELKALQSCAANGGFMRNAAGEMTTRKARVQASVFNAMSKFNINRRSHDKLLVVDGHFPEQAAVITGGRNISRDYYGINEDGSEDPTAFRDLEIMLRVDPARSETGPTVGDVSEDYFSLLFLYDGNNRLGSETGHGDPDGYRKLRGTFRERLEFLESLPKIQERFARMETFTTTGFHRSPVRLAHQLNNLTSSHVATRRKENLLANPNSIGYIITKVIAEGRERGDLHGTLRIISPYLFSAKYKDESGKVVFDAARAILDMLNEFPDTSVEIVTNSVMTSDNPFTQAIIDMDMAPRLLLTPALQEAWLSGLKEGELESDVVKGEEWKRMVGNPRVRIYQTGRLDSVILGGSAHYGKLHAKCIFTEAAGFVGTSNFDYRSMLYNNEMGFFFNEKAVSADLLEIFEELKATSYPWGSPEWLEMRRKVMESDSRKASPARKQRMIFKTIRGLGLEYLM